MSEIRYCPCCGKDHVAHEFDNCRGCRRDVCLSCYYESITTIYSPRLCKPCRVARTAEQIDARRHVVYNRRGEPVTVIIPKE